MEKVSAEKVGGGDYVLPLSISIVNYNSAAYARRAVESVLSNTQLAEYEVIVVDNGGSDEGVYGIDSLDKRVTLIDAGENLGFARANNLAFSRARGKYFLLLNPDTEVLDGAIDGIVQFMEENPECAAVGPRLLNEDGTLQYSCRAFPDMISMFFTMTFLEKLFPGNRVFGRYRMTYWNHDTLREVDQPMGACLLFRSDRYREFDMLDERFFMYFEEVDMCRRMKSSGHKIYFFPASEVIHFENQSSKTDPVRASQYYFKSMVEYFRKHEGKGSLALLKPLIYLGLTLRLSINIWRWFLSGRENFEEYSLRVKQFYQLMFKVYGF